MKKITKNDVNYYFFEISTFNDFPQTPSKHFVCIFYSDENMKGIQDSVPYEFATKILKSGAKYIMACGKMATSIETSFDDAIVREKIKNVENGTVLEDIMTTSHQNSLDEIIYWAKYHALPQINDDTKGDIVIFIVNNPNISQKITELLS